MRVCSTCQKKVNTNRIHSLYEALVKRHPSLEATYYAILNEGLKAFNLSLGIISQVEDERYTLLAVSPINQEISQGMIFELKNTHCQWVINEKKIISIEHAGAHADFKSHPVYIGMKLESYISTPIRVREKI